MPEEVKKVNGAGGDATSPSPAEVELNKKIELLDGVTQRLQAQEVVGKQVMGDPEFQKYMALKNAGKKIEVREVGDAEPAPDPLQVLLDEHKQANESDDKESIEDMTKAEMIKLMSEVSKVSVEGALKEALKPIQEATKGLQDGISARAQEDHDLALGKEVNLAVESHSDLKDYEADMVKLHDDIIQRGRPTTEQLYKLAKIDKLGLPTEKNPDSERPHNLLGVVRPAGASKAPSGRAGFQSVLRKHLDSKY